MERKIEYQAPECETMEVRIECNICSLQAPAWNDGGDLPFGA